MSLPSGLGANVHSQLVPGPLVRPLFAWVRFDLSRLSAGKTPTASTVALIRSAQTWYGAMGCGVLWCVDNVVGIQSLVSAGIKGAAVEFINEPNIAFPADPKWNNPGRRAYGPVEYVALLKQASILCRRMGYTLIAPSVSTWKGWDGVAWMLGAAGAGLLNYCDAVSSHPYGVLSDHDLWDLINMQRTAWGGKPFLFTEFCSPKMDSKTLADIVRQAAFEKIAFCLYDLGATDPAVQLIDNLDLSKAAPTQLYRDLFANLMPGAVPSWT